MEPRQETNSHFLQHETQFQLGIRPGEKTSSPVARTLQHLHAHKKHDDQKETTTLFSLPPNWPRAERLDTESP